LQRKKIGGKWKPIILMILRDKPARFNKIKQLMPGVSGNMLTKSLKELERDGLIRKVDGEHVVYCLTDRAVKIVDLLLQIKLLVENL
jgi:DNA-binding HxlR family transcriptional regulator